MANESSCDKFKMMKALRQGDLIAPFLFFLTVEGLNGLFKQVSHLNKLARFRVRINREVEITILQLVKNTIFYGG